VQDTGFSVSAVTTEVLVEESLRGEWRNEEERRRETLFGRSEKNGGM